MMAGILDNANRHLLLEDTQNQGNSFIANVNKVANDLENVDKVASDLANIDVVADAAADILTVAENIADVVKVAILKPSIESVAAIADDIPLIVEKLDTIQAIFDKLPEIDFIFTNYEQVQTNLAKLEQLADRLTHDQNELIALTNDNKTFVTESEIRINGLINEISGRVQEATALVESVQGIKDDIDAALREALLPVVTDEIVENASDRALEILTNQFAGNTDFVQTYLDTYAGIEEESE